MTTVALAAVVGLAAIPLLAKAQSTLIVGTCDDLPSVISVDTVLELSAPEVCAHDFWRVTFPNYAFSFLVYFH